LDATVSIHCRMYLVLCMQFAGFLKSTNLDAEQRKPQYWMQLFANIVGCT
jgi:hypothetical protein